MDIVEVRIDYYFFTLYIITATCALGFMCYDFWKVYRRIEW